MNEALIQETLENQINGVLWLAKMDSNSFFHPKIYFRQICQ